MASWFRKQPAGVPTDTVIPVGFFDDTIIFRTFTVYVMFVYDEVLDADRLRNTLTNLVSRPGWNKLGARLRKASSGSGFEHHIPASFSKERPAINYTTADYTDTLIDDHPVASKLPRPPTDGVPAFVCDPEDVQSLVYGEGVPIYADDYLYSDRPQFGLRIVSFADATIVVPHWIHLSFDSMGFKSVLDAWQLILEDRADEVPSPLLANVYPLQDYGLHPTEPHVLEALHLKITGVLGWAMRNLWTIAVAPKASRVLCIPPQFWKKIHADAVADLKAQGLTPPDDFLSEGDVILAWFARLAVSHYDKETTSFLVNIQQAVDIRSKLPGIFGSDPAKRPFLGNAMSFMVEPMPIRDVLTKPLSYIAHAIRKALVAQTTPEQVEAYGALVRQDPVNKAPPFFGETGMHLLMCTNWCKAKLYEADLGAAAEDVVDGKRDKKVLRPRYIQTIQGPYDFPDGIFVVGKDAEENYWMSAKRLTWLWDVMDKVIQEECKGM